MLRCNGNVESPHVCLVEHVAVRCCCKRPHSPNPRPRLPLEGPQAWGSVRVGHSGGTTCVWSALARVELVILGHKRDIGMVHWWGYRGKRGLAGDPGMARGRQDVESAASHGARRECGHGLLAGGSTTGALPRHACRGQSPRGLGRSSDGGARHVGSRPAFWRGRGRGGGTYGAGRVRLDRVVDAQFASRVGRSACLGMVPRRGVADCLGLGCVLVG